MQVMRFLNELSDQLTYIFVARFGFERLVGDDGGAVCKNWCGKQTEHDAREPMVSVGLFCAQMSLHISKKFVSQANWARLEVRRALIKGAIGKSTAIHGLKYTVPEIPVCVL